MDHHCVYWVEIIWVRNVWFWPPYQSNVCHGMAVCGYKDTISGHSVPLLNLILMIAWSAQKIMHKIACIESCRGVDNAAYAIFNANSLECLCANSASSGQLGNKQGPQLCNANEMYWVGFNIITIMFLKTSLNSCVICRRGQSVTFLPQNHVGNFIIRSKSMFHLL